MKKATPIRPNHAIPRTTEYHKLCKRIWIHESRHIIIDKDGEEEARKSRTGRAGRWVTDMFELLLNFEFETYKAVVLRCPISFKFRLHPGCIFDKTKDFPDLKINTNQQLLWSLLTTRACGRRARTCRLFSKSGLGSIRL